MEKKFNADGGRITAYLFCNSTWIVQEYLGFKVRIVTGNFFIMYYVIRSLTRFIY